MTECSLRKIMKLKKNEEISESDGVDIDISDHISSSEDEFGIERRSKTEANLTSDVNSREENPHTVHSTFNVKELTSDDEIYLLQCPENCTKDLVDKNIDFSKGRLSISSNEVYKVELLNLEKQYVTLAVPEKTNNGSLVKLPLKGHIIIQKDIHMVPSESKYRKVSDFRTVAFPTDIKVRHPLLGVDWKSHIESANKALKKGSPNKRKSKKIKEEITQENLETETKKSKRKHSQTESDAHKKKKQKYDI